MTSQLAAEGVPNWLAISVKPGTITQPTMIVRQATAKSVNAAIFLNSRIECLTEISDIWI
ncbi:MULTISPECIES: hypothetical protein [Serratia]|uniref:hypothetical protein n=1 Tax=Serratia TaxID=613 RepID=UPI002102E609|nr:MULTISPECIES: hypothetical protein [Serratia]